MKRLIDTKQFILVCILLCGLLSIFGCKKEVGDDSKQPTYAINKSYEKGPLVVQVRVDKEQIKLSDLLMLELSTETESNYEIQFPTVTETLKQFKIRSWNEQPEKLAEDNKVVKTYQYDLEPLELGSCEIPALTFEFKSKVSLGGDTKTGPLTTESVRIEVSTSLSADPNDFMIADIEDVVEMKTNYAWLLILPVATVLIAAGVTVGILLKPKKKIAIPKVYKSAHEIAHEMLRAIAGEKLVEQGKIKEFYEKLSGCLRRYIENRFQLRAPEQTTEEFLEQLKKSDALKLEYKQELQKFLKHCDLVKFAKYEPDHKQINESLTMAEQFVDKTKSPDHQVEVTSVQSPERQGAA